MVKLIDFQANLEIKRPIQKRVLEITRDNSLRVRSVKRGKEIKELERINHDVYSQYSSIARS